MFQIVTLDNWSNILYNLEDAIPVPLVSSLFCMTIVVFGAFFLLNLMLAVVMESYIESEMIEDERRTK